MPLIKCPACAKEVSDQAASCPNCGHPFWPPAKKKSSSGAGVGLLVSFVFIVLIVGVVTSQKKSPEPITQQDLCVSDWARCANNEQLVNNYSRWFHVKAECKTEATKRASYGTPIWPWSYFGNFYTGTNYVTSGIAIAIEPDVQFSNAFGAMVHSQVTCTYDLRAERVMNVNIAPR